MIGCLYLYSSWTSSSSFSLPAGPPLHCSSGSSSPVASLYPPPAHTASESQGRLLSNCGPRADPDSESEDEFGPASSFLVKTGSGNVSVCAPGSAAADGECFTHRLWLYLRLFVLF
ncbi:teneurin-4 isoform X1 [Tachysurus ichikawai]